MKAKKAVSIPGARGKTTPMKVLQALMVKAFSREEMATHSLTGATCNVNTGKEARPQINPAKMEEIFSKSYTHPM